ncbi:TonB-dependent receptor [Sphingomonas sp. LT1P40]|uniref:TonB-dependent receptor n=1 Tax=Alteristakelama amylovorans TaxID=3096166 RepID=UPI002FC93A15
MVAYRTALRGTGLSAIATALLVTTPAFAQDAAEESEDILITAQRDNQSQVTRKGSLGALGEKDAMDTPFAIKSYNAALILNQQPQTLGQVLENDPSIRTTNGFGVAAELFVMRGFALTSDDISFNGMYGLTPRQLVAPELYEQVQVLNGASAFLNGAAPGGSGLGGGINLIAKRAGSKSLNRLTANYAGTSHFGGSFDVARRFGNGEFGVRINGALRGGDVAIDDENRKATVLGAGFDYTTDNLRIGLDLAYQRLDVRGLRHKVAITTVIPTVPRSDVNYSQQWQYANQRDIFGQLSIEYDVAENATLYGSFGARDGWEESVALNAVTVAAADVPTGRAVSGNAQYTPRTDNNEALLAGFRYSASAWGISHELNVGTSFIWQVNRNAYQRYGTYVTNIYNPVAVARPAETTVRGGNINDPFPIAETNLGSVFVSDTLGLFDDKLLVTVGARHQAIEVTRYAYNVTVTPVRTLQPGDRQTYYKESATTPVVGVVVKPSEMVSLYANRIEGLVQGEVAPNDATLINANEVFAPFKTVQYELGGKIEIGGINASLAFFQSDRPNGFSRNIAPAPTTGPLREYVIDGLQRNKGAEFSIDGEIVKGFRIIAGAAINDATLQRTAGGVNQGNKVPGVPDYTANANVEVDLGVVPVTLTGRVIHTGPQMVNQTNTLELDSWTRFDLGARFVAIVGDSPITFRLNVDNVFNKRYWASAFTSFPTFDASLLQGAPRTLKLSLTADF